MKKITFLMAIVLTLFSCQQFLTDTDKITSDNYDGKHKMVLLTDEMAGFDGINPTCYIMAPDGNVIKRKATTSEIGEVSQINLTVGLKEGKYRLLYLEYSDKSEKGADIIKRHGIGRLLEVDNQGIEVSGTYSTDWKLSGSGEKENPYIITCDQDLQKLAHEVNNPRIDFTNSDTYFKQVADIDMALVSALDYGFTPIGNTNNTPFYGCYDGSGYAIRNLKVVKKDLCGAGLFGYINQAVIVNVKIEKSDISGSVGVGAIAGATITSGSSKDQSFIQGCSVIDTKIYGSAIGTGGILGMVDARSQALVDSCFVLGNTQISGGYAVGGIVGSGNTCSFTVITNCKNESKGQLGSKYSGAGGIVGSADTLLVVSCINKMSVQSETTLTSAAIGSGGIAGGSGVSQFITCVNEGNVSGFRGAGGILGSSIVNAGSSNDENGAIYNNAIFTGCANRGNVNGLFFVGGICGEAQIACYGSYNEGKISAIASESYVGGIIGAAPIGVINNSNNFGEICGFSYCSGIGGRVSIASMSLNGNTGKIFANGNYVGGIVGLTGNTSAIHYCSNFGYITNNSSKGDSFTGGIVGAIGDPKTWTRLDKASCVVAVADVTLSIIGIPIAVISYVGKVVRIGLKVATVGSKALIMTTKGAIKMFEIIGKVSSFSKIEQICTFLEGRIESDYRVITGEMNNKFEANVKGTQIPLVSGLRRDVIDNEYLKSRRELIAHYEKENGGQYQNSIDFNNKINEKLAARAESLSKFKRSQKTMHSLLNGVCVTVGVGIVATSIAVNVLLWGTGTPLVIALDLAVMGAVFSVIGGVNSITAKMDELADNVSFVSQCVNAGTINASKGSHMGGIVGSLQQNCNVSNCLNVSPAYSGKNGSAIIAEMGRQSSVIYCINPSNDWGYMYDPPLGIYHPYEAGANMSLPVTHYKNGIEEITVSQMGQLKPFTSFTYFEINNNGRGKKLWWLKEGDGNFPVPHKSEMQ